MKVKEEKKSKGKMKVKEEKKSKGKIKVKEEKKSKGKMKVKEEKKSGEGTERREGWGVGGASTSAKSHV